MREMEEKDLEKHYQNVLFIICRLLGFYTHAEYHTSSGRIDLLVESIVTSWNSSLTAQPRKPSGR